MLGHRLKGKTVKDLKVIGLHPDDPILSRTFGKLKLPFVRLISSQKFRFECELERPINSKVYVATNLFSSSAEETELFKMKSKNHRDYHFDFIAPEPRKGFIRVVIESENKNEFYGDAFFPTFVETQPKGLDLVRMYSMLPLASGPIKDWIGHFREIKRMGFDCVHLLPLTKMGHSQSPYSAADFFQIDPMYCDDQTELKKFIDKVKVLKVRLCFDLVLNHLSPDSKMVKENPDWIQPDTNESDGFKRAGCWHNSSWIRWDDLVLINFDHPDPKTKNDIWAVMKEYAIFWAELANETGGMIRLDNLHSSNKAFISYLRDELKKMFPNLIIFAEFFADEITLLKKSRDWDLNLLLGQPWHHDFVPELRTYFEEIHRQGLQLHHIMPITTHDTPAIKEMYSDNCYTVPRYAASSFLSCGKTGITMGVEIGVEEKQHFIGKPYKLDIGQKHPYKKEIAKINEILEEMPVLRCAINITFIDHGNEAYLVAYRNDLSGEDKDVVIMVSMDKHRHREYNLEMSLVPEGYEMKFKECYTEESVVIENGDRVMIPPCGYRIFERI